jgi:hypothetical protein
MQMNERRGRRAWERRYRIRWRFVALLSPNAAVAQGMAERER